MCTAASDETLESDCLGLSFWRVSNIIKIPITFKPECSLNLTPMLFFVPRFPLFSINGYNRKANTCSPWTSCCVCHTKELNHYDLILVWQLCFWFSKFYLQPSIFIRKFFITLSFRLIIYSFRMLML